MARSDLEPLHFHDLVRARGRRRATVGRRRSHRGVWLPSESPRSLLSELEALAGRTLETREQVRDAARELIGRGVSVVAVSLGSGGAVIADRDEAWFAPALDVEVRSTVGAGDAMVAGLAAGLLMDAELERVFAMGVASASAMCMTEGTDALSRADYKRLLEAVRPERI